MGSTAERVKTTAIVIAYLASFMVVAIPVGMAPTDSTPDTTPAQGHRDITTLFDFGLHNSTMAGNAHGLHGDTPEVDTKLHFTVHNISDSNNTQEVALFAPTVNTANWKNNHTWTRTSGSDGDLEADFPSVNFNETGEWTILYAPHNDTSRPHTFNVSGVKDIEVTVSPETLTFPGDDSEIINVQATWADNGSAVEGAEVNITARGNDVEIVNTPDETDSDGELEFSHNFWKRGGAQTYDVVVCFPGESTGDCRHTNTDNVTMVVEPADLRAEDIDGEPVTRGFADSVDYDLRYPTNDPRAPRSALSQSEADTSSLDWNITLLENSRPICEYSHLQSAGDLFDAEIVNGTGTQTGQLSNQTEATLRVPSIAGNPTTAELTSPNGSTFDTGTIVTHTADDVAWFNTTLFPASPHSAPGHASWNVTITYAGGSTSTTAFDVADPCSAARDEVESAGSMQDGNFTVTKVWNNTDYTTGVELDRIGDVRPEYVFNQSISTQAPEPPVLDLANDKGDVPDGCLQNCGGGLGASLAPQTGSHSFDHRPNGSEVNPNGDALTSTASTDGNGQYVLDIQGTTADEFPEPANLTIEVMGPYLGTPAYFTTNGTQLGTNQVVGEHWEIPNGRLFVRNITPTRGDSRLTFEVTWDHPDKGTVSDTVKHRIHEGVTTSVDHEEITVGETTVVTVNVAGSGGTPIPDAQVTLFWNQNGTVINQSEGNDTAGFGQDGDYTFEVDINGAVGKVTAHADDQFDKDGYAEFEIVPAHDLDTQVSPDGDLAGRDTEYTLNITRNGEAFDDSGDDVDIHVMNQDQWEDFQANGTSDLPSALSASEYSRDSEGNFTFDWQAESGTYYVYVTTEPKNLHDNQGQVPTIELEPADISWDPETLVSKVDEDVRVDVHLHDPTASGHDDSEVNGTLFLRTGADMILSNGDHEANATFGNNSAGSVTVATDTGGTRSVAGNATSIDITDGDGHIDNVTAERPGPVWGWFQDSESGAVFALGSPALQIVAPDVQITPDLVCVGVTTQVTATVTHPITDDPISGANFTLRQSGVKVANGTTNANGIARVTVFLTNSTQVNVDINGDRAETFTPKNCMSISFDQQTYTAGDTVRVTVSQRGNPDVQIQGATILLNGNSQGATGSDGSMTFEAPSAGTHRVRAQKSGFADATADFETESATAPAQFSVSGVSVEDADTYLVDNTYTVTGTITNNGDETGTTTAAFLVDGAQTDSTTLTLDAGQSQQVAFQWTPSSTGDVSLGISADGDSRSTTVTVEEEEPTVPGFEVLAVLAALGAAAVVLRRD